MDETQVVDAHKLHADAVVFLYHIILRDGSHLRLKPDNDVVWQGYTWEGVGIKMGGVSNSADAGEKSRPNLVITNPAGVFSSFVVNKKLDRAEVIRLRVLKAHLDANLPIFTQQSWRVMKPTGVNEQVITLELRSQLDGPHFITPARMFIAPEFPTVTT